MKNKSTLSWLYNNSKKQLPIMLLLIIIRCSLTILGVVFALSSKAVIDSAIAKDFNAFLYSAIQLFSIIAFQILIRFIGKHIETKTSVKMQMAFRKNFLCSYIGKNYSSATAYHSGDIMTRIESDISIVSSGILSLLPGVIALISGLLYALYTLTKLDKNFTFIFLFGGIAVLLLISSFRGITKRLHKNVQEAESRLRSFLQEVFKSLLVIKVFGLENSISKKTDDLQHESYSAQMKRKNLTIFASSGLSLVFSLGSLYALVWSAFRLYKNAISFGTLTAILQLVNQIQGPFAGLSDVIPRYYTIIASAERIIEIEQLPKESDEQTPLSPQKAYSKLNSIRFESISFCYGREVLFENANLCINKGDFAVISGISGIGKSTLIKLLLGVISPNEGRIFLSFSDEDVNVGKHTRPLFSYVPQGNLLLSGTIRDAIALIKPDATDEQIMEAAEISCAASFINQFPEGLDTLIGENGLGLSEGQIQRLSIARAILSDAPILLLDEATSALDERTEEQLLQNLRRMDNKTCIIISHKQAASQICNKQIVIADKKISLSELAHD